MAHPHININCSNKAPTPLSTPPALPPHPSLISISYIRQNVVWIRDTLDPLVAREGPAALTPHEVLAIHAFLGRVRDQPFNLETIRQTRLYQLLTLLRGKATRWPPVIIDECDEIIELWTVQFGSLRGLRTPLYENGGRLFGICKARDLSTSDLLRRFAKLPGQSLEDSRAVREGHLGFQPGSWWINTTFAFREGIITKLGIKGGVCVVNKEAYALVLVDFQEHDSHSPDEFKYVSKAGSFDASAIVSTFVKHRAPIRVLRSHRLQSLWSPIVGVRYDGLYVVKGWTVVLAAEGKMKYIVRFERLEGQVPMDTVMMSPTAEEQEDYQEYYRLRAVAEKISRKRKGMPEKQHSDVWGTMSNNNPMLANRFSRNPQSEKTSGEITVGSLSAIGGETIQIMATATTGTGIEIARSGKKNDQSDLNNGILSESTYGRLGAKESNWRSRSFRRSNSDQVIINMQDRGVMQMDGAVALDSDSETDIDEDEDEDEMKDEEDERLENQGPIYMATKYGSSVLHPFLDLRIPLHSNLTVNGFRRNTLPSTTLLSRRDNFPRAEEPERRLSSLSTIVNYVLAEILDDANIRDEGNDFGNTT